MRARGAKAKPFALAGDPLPEWREAEASLKRWLLTRALAESGGNISGAACRLGVTKVAVLHAVRRHGLEAAAGAGREE